MDKERLKQLLLVALSSDQPGEVTGAINAAKKLLKKDGKDIHWLAGQLVNGGQQAPPQIIRVHDDPPPWKAMLVECFERSYTLLDHEEKFIHDCFERYTTDKYWGPTDKQFAWLVRIHRRL